jgi:putative oxidoreductase
VTFAAELAGGVLLLLGVYTRYVALVLVPILLGATWAHAGNGWVFSAPNGGWEYPAFLALAAVVQFFVGDGALAIRRSTQSDDR